MLVTHSHPPLPTHSRRTRALAHTHTPALTLSLFTSTHTFTYSRTLSRTLSLAHPPTHTHSLPPSHPPPRFVSPNCPGGGWCYGPDANSTIRSCAGRGGFVWPPKGDAKSSDSRSETTDKSNGDTSTITVADRAGLGLADMGGVMAQDPTVNPDFYTWNKVRT